MDPHKYDTIFHAEHDLFCPLSRARLESVIELLALTPSSRVLDCSAGKGELFVRILERYGCSGIAFESGATFFQTMRSEVLSRLDADRVELIEGEFWEAEFENESFDLIINIGPPPYGDLEMSLGRLWATVKSGGQVLLGLTIWTDDEPDEAFMDVLGVGAESYPTHDKVFALAVTEDFTPIYAATASRADLDHYEGLGLWASEKWLRGHGADPDAVEVRERLHALRDAWVKAGRFELGFGIYLLLK